MAILTTKTVGTKKSETLLDWAGNPYSPSRGEAYGGKPEHWPPAERLKGAREKLAKTPMTEERRSALRAAMAYARSKRRGGPRTADSKSAVSPSVAR